MDRSKTLEEYYEMGITDLDQEWDFSDLDKAMRILEEQLNSDPYILPKEDSRKSSRLYHQMIKMIPEINIPEKRDFIFLPVTRYDQFRKYAVALNFLYLNSAQVETELYYSNERLDLHEIFILNFTNYCIVKYDYLEKLEYKDRDKKHEDMTNLQEGIFLVYEGIFFAYSDKVQNRNIDKIELGYTLSDNVEKVWTRLNQVNQELILNHSKSISEFDKNPEIRKIFSNLISQLK